MEPLSRRSALILGGAGTIFVAAGAAGLLWAQNGGLHGISGEDFVEPQALHSAEGRLEVKLSAARGRVRVAGRDAATSSYNGRGPGLPWW